jgi:hypothetical protein
MIIAATTTAAQAETWICAHQGLADNIVISKYERNADGNLVQFGDTVFTVVSESETGLIATAGEIITQEQAKEQGKVGLGDAPYSIYSITLMIDKVAHTFRELSMSVAKGEPFEFDYIGTCTTKD